MAHKVLFRKPALATSSTIAGKALVAEIHKEYAAIMDNRIDSEGNMEAMLEHDVRQECSRVRAESELTQLKLEVADALFDDMLGETGTILQEIEADEHNLVT